MKVQFTLKKDAIFAIRRDCEGSGEPEQAYGYKHTLYVLCEQMHEINLTSGMSQLYFKVRVDGLCSVHLWHSYCCRFQ